MPLPEHSASIARFSGIDPDTLVMAYIFGAAHNRVEPELLVNQLSWVLDGAACEQCLRRLEQRGDVEIQRGAMLTRKGEFSARANFGREGQGRWSFIRSRLLPLITLHLQPSDPITQRHYLRPENFRAETIRVGFGLQCPTGSSVKVVCGELVWRTLESAIPGIQRETAPFANFGATERAILAAVTSQSAVTFHEIVGAIASASVGVEFPVSMSTLRNRLIEIGVQLFTGSSADDSIRKPMKT